MRPLTGNRAVSAFAIACILAFGSLGKSSEPIGNDEEGKTSGPTQMANVAEGVESAVNIPAVPVAIVVVGPEFSAQHPQTSTTIPLCPGLTIVTAISQRDGDYESIKTIESVNPNELRMKISAEIKSADAFSSKPPELKMLLYHRTVLTSDLESASLYQQIFLDKSSETIPGSTSIGTSAMVLRALKTKGEADLGISNAYGGLELSADRNHFPSYYHYTQMGKIKKVGTARLSVLVNDRPAELAAIQAQGDFVGDKAEFFFLDDERNPLTLAFRIGIGGIKPLIPEAAKLCETLKKSGNTPPAMLLAGGRCDMPNGGDRDTLRVIKINSRCTASAVSLAGSGGGEAPNATDLVAGDSSGVKAIEQALTQNQRVDIYSIYFSFNSDAIRDESQLTLKDIAEVMRRHPDWKLQVNGHTDGIGADAFNLDLSKRRAAAVKDALVKQYKINGDRLATTGFGKSEPKDTNDTLEGRARNRRVELMRVS